MKVVVAVAIAVILPHGDWEACRIVTEGPLPCFDPWETVSYPD